MKRNLCIICCLAMTLTNCSVDEDTTTTLTEDVITTIENQIVPDTPNPENDYSRRGLYQGTIVTEDLSFHEKITLNLGDNGQYNAQIITSNEERYLFKSQNTINSEFLYFEGDQGTFTVQFLEDDTVQLSNIIINEKEAVATVFKDQSFQRMMPSLGTFSSSDNTISGTWDFAFTVSGGLGYSITTTTIFINQNSETFVLNTSGDYQRLCSAPGTPVPIGVVNSSFFNIQSVNNVPLGNSELSFIFVANRLEATNAGCRITPSAPLDVTSTSWTWNGLQGTATVDTSSLPDFSGF
ncbi:hypothetical protein [uncultured Dokdonia sp.]|uniref:hypothetical protein n=1 Tax=uncultured Dokdonia sp. TaxID=575653 RepID=UPI00262B4299|nr:hypothetical protein [uncultured Dokdonia sp.]